MFGRFMNSSIPNDKITEDYDKKSHEIVRASLVANDESLEALTRFNAEFGSATLRILLKRVPLQKLHNQRKNLTDQTDRFLAQNQSYIDMQSAEVASGHADQQKFQSLQRMIDIRAKKIDELIEAQKKMDLEIKQAEIEFVKYVFGEMKAITVYTRPLLVCFKKELGLIFDEERYLRISDEAEAKITREFEEFLSAAASLS